MQAEYRGQLAAQARSIVIVGAGLSGMVLALDLARRGQRVTLLEKSDGVLRGSRAITYSPTTLEIFCALGCEDRVLGEAVHWSTGTEYLSGKRIRSTNYAESSQERFTGYRSLPQPAVHESLMGRIRASHLVDLWLECEVQDVRREGGGLIGVRAMRDGVSVDVLCNYLVAADGAHSSVRKSLGLTLIGERVADTFLICDLDTEQPLASDRTVWFDPPFGGGKVALLLKYGRRKYRFDVHMPSMQRLELDERAVHGIIQEAFGEDFEYRLDFWTSYHFACEKLEQFCHDSIFFIGDAAHLVPPFGARGGNSGIEDAFNLSWKLTGVLQGRYSEDLLATYGTERQAAALQNLNEVGRTMRFLLPQSPLDRSIRNAALELCGTDPLAVRIVNSGSMSRPNSYDQETQVNFRDRARSLCIPPVLKKVPNFPMRWRGESVYLHDRLGLDFSVVVLAHAEGPGLLQERCLKSDLSFFKELVETLVVVEAEPPECLSSSVIWDDQCLLKDYLAGSSDAVLLIRPDRYLLGLAEFGRTESLRAVLDAMLTGAEASEQVGQ